MNRIRSISYRPGRCGAATVEFALVAPLFLLLILGIIEFGRMLMVQQILTNATREGARRAVIEGATAEEVRTLVDRYLSNASVSGSTVTVTPHELGYLGFGDSVTVEATVPFDSVSWTPSPWFLGGSTLRASTVMQAERFQ
ncbi:TadE/TadG family type IV pilus assembly protein [Alienimonas sp. DA493]|uniref:TadE/TadG family type IV pilus assembly protein n=1 Tax=Alienimonas sp. DA493 TaxID=3373605 RepID=UPI003754243E